MAHRIADVREKILKEGAVRHRQPGLALPRWRPRYIVFKVTNAGRLQFVIYKEQPTIPANELKEIAIDEFGGLEVGLKIDSERHVFAMISTGVTDCFSTESPDEMLEWSRLLQQYLGKELVLNVSVPFRQNILRSGKAQLRIRNTGFTITTCDTPPRCQGTWQIIHIRKFGGTDAFRFQAGSKCPTGEFLYTLNTEDNGRVKALFNDLSQHKPIFPDDRLGRRLTLNHRVRSPDTPTDPTGHQRAGNRYSLQSQPQPEYENRQVITESFHHNSADPVGISPPTGRRHSSVDGQIYSPKQRSMDLAQVNGSPKSSHSIEDLSRQTYQNIFHPPMHSNGRRSPQKKSSYSDQVPIAEHVPDVPDGYYTVSPPMVIKMKKSRSSNSTSPPQGYLSSPDEEETTQVRTEPPRRPSPPIGEERREVWEDYVKLSPSLPGTAIEGDQLVVRRGDHDVSPPPVPPGPHQPAVYQNLKFLKRSGGGGGGDDSDKFGSPSVSRVPLPSATSVSSSALQQYPSPSGTPTTPSSDWSPHALYTNVELAFESAHGTSGGKAGRSGGSSRRGPSSRVSGPETTPLARVQNMHGRKSSLPMCHDPNSNRTRKISAPNLAKEQPIPVPGGRDHSAIGRVLEQSQSVRLTSSQSNFELRGNRDGRKYHSDWVKSGSPQDDYYYNHFVLDLPAFSSTASDHSSVSLVTTQSQLELAPRDYRQFSPTGDNQGCSSPISAPPTGDPSSRVMSNGYARLHEGALSDPHGLQGEYVSIDQVHRMALLEDRDVIDGRTTGNVERTVQSNYDRLKIRPGSKSPCFSPVPSASNSRMSSPRPGCYDTLAPIETTAPRQSYTSRSSSSSPEGPPLPPNVVHNKTVRYKRKVALLGHGHDYQAVSIETEEIEENLGDGSGEDLPSRKSLSPEEGREHRGDWIGLPDLEDSDCRKLRSGSPALRRSHKSPNTQSRRKPLPLQSVESRESLNSESGAADTVGPSLEGSHEQTTSSSGMLTPPLPQKKSRGSGECGSPKTPRKPTPLPRQNRLSSHQSTDSDLLSSVESRDNECLKRESTLSTESMSSVELEMSSNLQADQRGVRPVPKARTPPPPRHQEGMDHPSPNEANKIVAVTVEVVTKDPKVGAEQEEEKVESLPELPPKIPPKRTISNGTTNSDDAIPPLPAKTSRSPPMHPKNNTLPAHPSPITPPALPPRPSSLHHGHHHDSDKHRRPPRGKQHPPLPPTPQELAPQYAVVAFERQKSDSNYSFVRPVSGASRPPLRKAQSAQLKAAVSNSQYSAINHVLTAQLGRYKEEVEDQRNKEKEFLKETRRKT